MQNNFKQYINYIFIILSITSIACFQEDSLKVSTNLAISDTSNANQKDLFNQLLNECKIFFIDAIISDKTDDTLNTIYEFDNLFNGLAQLELISQTNEYDKQEFLQILNAAIQYYDEDALTVDHLSTGFSTALFQEKLDDYIYHQSLEDIINVEESVEVIDGHIPITYNKKVNNVIEFYKKDGRAFIQNWLNRQQKFKEIILPILAEEGVPPEIFYVAMVESGLRTDAKSWAAAVGPWQFIQSTGNIYGLKQTAYIDERRDFEKSTRAAARYFKDLYNEFGDWYLAFAAYNGGSGRIHRHLKCDECYSGKDKCQKPYDFWCFSEHSYFPRETRNYVPSILAIIFIAKEPEKYGFTINPEPSFIWNDVEIKKSVYLSDIAIASGIDEKVLRSYNPELTHQEKYKTNEIIIPVDSKNPSYTFRMPLDCDNNFTSNLSNVPSRKLGGNIEIVVYKIKRGDSFWKLAVDNNTTITAICELNNLNRNKALRIGQKIKIPKNSKGVVVVKKYHTVKFGDTLSGIAVKYRTSVKNIKKWNGLRSSTIHPGQKLRIK